MKRFYGVFNFFFMEGVYMFRNGAKYTGFYEQGHKSGYGVFDYPDGSKYEGTFYYEVK